MQTYILLFSLLVISFIVPYESQAQYKTYLPIVQYSHQNKAGIAFASHVEGNTRVSLLNGTVSFWRGWQISDDDKWGLEGIPNLWCDMFGRKDITTTLTYMLDDIDSLGADYDGYILFLNEPDITYYGHRGQCEVTPYRAAQIYQHVKETIPNAKLVGPGIHHIDYVNNFEWLNLFWDAVVSITGEKPDMYAWDIHNYMNDENPLAPYNALEDWLYIKSGGTIDNPKFFISEWSARSPERLVEMKDAFDGDDRIIRHYWFDGFGAHWDPQWVQDMSMFKQSGDGSTHLSEMGETWVNIYSE